MITGFVREKAATIRSGKKLRMLVEVIDGADRGQGAGHPPNDN